MLWSPSVPAFLLITSAAGLTTDPSGLCGGTDHGWVYWSDGPSCYLWGEKTENNRRKGSLDTCRGQNATLVTITSFAEFEFLNKSPPNGSYWIGLKRRNGIIDNWKWVTKEKLSPSEWHPWYSNNTYPEYGNLSLQCATMQGSQYRRKWWVTSCDSNQPTYLCEKEPISDIQGTEGTRETDHYETTTDLQAPSHASEKQTTTSTFFTSGEDQYEMKTRVDDGEGHTESTNEEMRPSNLWKILAICFGIILAIVLIVSVVAVCSWQRWKRSGNAQKYKTAETMPSREVTCQDLNDYASVESVRAPAAELTLLPNDNLYDSAIDVLPVEPEEQRKCVPPDNPAGSTNDVYAEVRSHDRKKELSGSDDDETVMVDNSLYTS